MPEKPGVPNIGLGYGGYPYSIERAKVTSYTISKKENGTLFTNAASTTGQTFTLPALSPFLFFGFQGIADFTTVVKSAEGTNIVGLNNASASTLAFQTGSQLIGGHVMVFANAAGTKWYAMNLSAGVAAVTVG